MIRRDQPLGDSPSHWLLISQVEHARLSHQLAAAWRGPLIEGPDSARQEFLAAVLHHDDGWIEWQATPKLDPQYGRPYSFTEMPPAEAQAIWSRSVDACAELGPLAGWVVASHFIDLQSKQDDDFSDWARWLGEQDRRRSAWLAEWMSDSRQNSQAVADRCLFLLQTFDWLSLWLCCKAAVVDQDPLERLTLEDQAHDFGPWRFSAVSAGRLQASPWPFSKESISLRATATRVAAQQYSSAGDMQHEPQALSWSLTASRNDT